MAKWIGSQDVFSHRADTARFAKHLNKNTREQELLQNHLRLNSSVMAKWIGSQDVIIYRADTARFAKRFNLNTHVSIASRVFLIKY